MLAVIVDEELAAAVAEEEEEEGRDRKARRKREKGTGRTRKTNIRKNEEPRTPRENVPRAARVFPLVAKRDLLPKDKIYTRARRS